MLKTKDSLIIPSVIIIWKIYWIVGRVFFIFAVGYTISKQ